MIMLAHSQVLPEPQVLLGPQLWFGPPTDAVVILGPWGPPQDGVRGKRGPPGVEAELLDNLVDNSTEEPEEPEEMDSANDTNGTITCRAYIFLSF